MSRCTRSGNILDVADPERCWCHFLLPGSCFPDAKETAMRLQSGVPEGLSWQRMFLILTNLLMMTCCVVQGAIHRTWFPLSQRPAIFTSSVFLNSTERVAALAMVMGLCLLVYNLGQRALRQALERSKQTIDNQLGKPTAPTLRWVFQCLMSIHLVTVAQSQQITNHRRTTLDSPVFGALSEILSPLLIDLRNVGLNANHCQPLRRGLKLRPIVCIIF